MGFLRKRMKEQSTWFGLAAAGVALVASKGVITPEVSSALLAAFGLVVVKESSEPK